MPVTIFVEGIPLHRPDLDSKEQAMQEWSQLRASNPEQAEQFLQSKAQLASTREALEAKAQQMGLTTEDVEAILARGQRTRTGIHTPEGAHTAETNAPQRAAIGAVRQAQSTARGARNIALRGLDRVAPGVSMALGIQDVEQFAEEERESRELFDQLDRQGIGMEDAGQLLSEALMFAGGGSVATGIKLLATAGRGTRAGLMSKSAVSEAMLNMFQQAADDPNSNVKLDAALGGGLGAVSGMVQGGIPGVRKLIRTGPAAMSLLAATAALSRRNGFLASTAMGRFMWQNQMGQRLMRAAPKTAEDLELQRQANAIATEMRKTLGTTISVLRRQHQENAAFGFARRAYDDAFEVVDGQTVFRASKFNQAMDLVTDKELKKMGVFGIRLQDIRSVARVIERAEADLIPSNEIPNILAGLARNPEARRLIPSLARAKTPKATQRILGRMAEAGRATLQEAAPGIGPEATRDILENFYGEDPSQMFVPQQQ